MPCATGLHSGGGSIATRYLVSVDMRKLFDTDKGAKLTDAYSCRIAKKQVAVSRWAVMERALNECGSSEAEIEEWRPS